METPSNILHWQLAAARTGAHIEYVPVTDEGELDLAGYARILDAMKPKLVALTQMSNVLGTLPPVTEMIAQAHAVGAVVLLDGAQSVPHTAVDVRALDCDFLAFSAHKMLRPSGIGVLSGPRERLEAMPPFLGGGDMIREVRLEGSTRNDLPWKVEAGTPPTLGPAGPGG